MEASLSPPRMVDDCWNRIGVEGDRSCPELKTAIHCRNCSVYSAAGRSLLEREAPEGYLEEWTNVLADIQSERNEWGIDSLIAQTAETVSIAIFRLGEECLALPVRLLQEVAPPCIIHTLPHRTNELFLGLVNIRGEILLCVSLSCLLGIDTAMPTQQSGPAVSKRMLVVKHERDRWVFPVDEVYGIYRIPRRDLQDAPVVVTKASEAYTQGIVNWQGKKVNALDSELLFYTLNRRIL